MKLVVFIILLSSFHAIAFDAASQQRINLDVKSLSIPQIIEKIEKEYNYRFVYNTDLKSSDIKLDLYARNATLDYVMQNMLKATTFSYKKINKGPRKAPFETKRLLSSMRKDLLFHGL